jgi:hypothetical protein
MLSEEPVVWQHSQSTSARAAHVRAGPGEFVRTSRLNELKLHSHRRRAVRRGSGIGLSRLSALRGVSEWGVHSARSTPGSLLARWWGCNAPEAVWRACGALWHGWGPLLRGGASGRLSRSVPGAARACDDQDVAAEFSSRCDLAQIAYRSPAAPSHYSSQTAKALALTMPLSVLEHAHHIIE